MLCGRWEEYPREFAKCRRCRKAKYCGKECQSTAWSEGHRFWCSAKDGDEEPPAVPPNAANGEVRVNGSGGGALVPVPVGTERRERRERHGRERERAAAAVATVRTGGNDANGGGTVRGFRSTGILGAHPTAVSAVFGGGAATVRGDVRERDQQQRPAQTVESTRARALALLRRTNPLGNGNAPPIPTARDHNNPSNYLTFSPSEGNRRRAETVAGGAPNHNIRSPQPQNPSEMERYLASFTAVGSTQGNSSSVRRSRRGEGSNTSSHTVRGSGSLAQAASQEGGDHDMVLG